MLRKKGVSSGGNLLSMRTRACRRPTIFGMCSISTGQTCMQAPQVVQVQISPSENVSGTMGGRPSALPATRARVVRQQMFFQVDEDHLRRQRLVRREGRAGVLAPAALHAGERVQPVLPGKVRGPAEAEALRILEVERGEGAGGPVAPEEEIDRPGEHVEVLGMRHVGDESVDEEDVEPPGKAEMRAERRRPGPGREKAREAPAEEREPGRFRMEGHGGGLEIEVAQRDQDDEGIDRRRISGRRPIGLGPDDEPADGEEKDADEDHDRGRVHEERNE